MYALIYRDPLTGKQDPPCHAFTTQRQADLFINMMVFKYGKMERLRWTVLPMGLFITHEATAKIAWVPK